MFVGPRPACVTVIDYCIFLSKKKIKKNEAEEKKEKQQQQKKENAFHSSSSPSSFSCRSNHGDTVLNERA